MTNHDIVQILTQQMKLGFDSLRADMIAGNDSLRADMTASIDALRNETVVNIDSLREEMHAGFKQTNARFEQVDAEIKQLRIEVFDRLSGLTSWLFNEGCLAHELSARMDKFERRLEKLERKERRA